MFGLLSICYREWSVSRCELKWRTGVPHLSWTPDLLGRCYLKVSISTDKIQRASSWSLPETERTGGAGERHQSCHYEHLRLSGVRANWWAKICCSISFQGVTISGDEEDCVSCLAVLNTKAFNSNSNHARGICCWGNSVCWELEGGHQFISHILFLQETQHN